MQSILLKNFKSYEQQSINNLNSRINVVLGANGQGKSNFFKGTLIITQQSHFYSLTNLQSIELNLMEHFMYHIYLIKERCKD